MPLAHRPPGSSPPIAIRRALEEGWQGFRRAPVVLMLFSLLVGGLNLLCQVLIRWSGELLVDPFGEPDPLALVLLLLAWLGYGVSNLWLMVGLLQGAELCLSGQAPSLPRLLRPGLTPLLRAGGTVALVMVLLAVISRLALASAWLMALIQPLLAWLPLLAGLVAVIYLLVDQILSLPISVLGGLNPLAAFRRGRVAIDPHWIQALGLTLLLGLLVLAGLLLLVLGLIASLPLAACTLVAAYRQLFPLAVPQAQAERKRG